MAGRTTWRWIFWATSIFQVVMTVASYFCFHETSGAIILRRRAARLREETGDQRYYTLGERLASSSTTASMLVRTITRPVRLLCFHPIIQLSALLAGFDYGIMYVTLSTFSDLWTTQYHQSVEISGLHYIACSLGEIAASQLGGPLIDYLYKRSQERGATPEARLPLVVPGFVVAWLGVLMYGWAAQYRQFWFVVDVGVFIMMFGLQLGGMPSKFLLLGPKIALFTGPK